MQRIVLWPSKYRKQVIEASKSIKGNFEVVLGSKDAVISDTLKQSGVITVLIQDGDGEKSDAECHFDISVHGYDADTSEQSSGYGNSLKVAIKKRLKGISE